MVFGINRRFLPIFYYNFSPLFVLKAPLFLFFVKSVLYSKFKFKWFDYLHFIPFIYKLIDVFPYLLTNYEYNKQIALSVLLNYEIAFTVDFLSYIPVTYELLFRNLQLIVYLSISVWIIRSFYKNTTFKNCKLNTSFIITRKWLYLLTSFLFITVSVSFFSILAFLYLGIKYTTYRSIIEMFYSIGKSFFILLPFIFIAFPQLLYGLTFSILKSKSFSENSRINNDNDRNNSSPKDIIARLNYRLSEISHKSNNITDPNIKLSYEIVNYFINSKPYLNVNFKIDDLSDVFNLPKYQIQYCINNVLNISFSNLKKEFRIYHALSLLEKNNISISFEGIGLMSGFKSNSNFYSSFKDITGKTPQDWRIN